MDDQMKTKLLEKLMDFLSQMPDKEELMDGGKDDAMEGSGEPKVEMLMGDAKPMGDEDGLEKLKGLV